MILIAFVMTLSTLLQSTIASAGPATRGPGNAEAQIAAADTTPETSAAWMKRSKELSQAVHIEDLRLVSVVGSGGGKAVAVIGRAVNQNTVALSLLAVHIALSSQGAPSGNVAMLRGKGDTIGPGASRNFGFALTSSATSGFAPLDPLPAETSPISDEDARRLGNVSAYVTYAGE
jgi:hypothetical protein